MNPTTDAPSEPDAIRLLWVDDDDDLRNAVAEMLTADGFTVASADSAEAALEEAPRFNPHLVLTDFRLPGQHGLHLARALRSRSPRLPILLVSSQLPETALAPWRRDPLFRSLAKPFELAQLEARIDELLAALTRLPDALPSPSPPSTPAEPAPEVGRTRPGKAGWLATATFLSLAVAGLLFLGKPLLHPAGSPPLPDVPVSKTKRGGSVLGLEPFGPIDQVPTHLRWQPYEGAESYHVEMHSLDGEVLIDALSEIPELEVAGQLRNALRPLSPYFWRVEAIASSSVPLAISETARIRIIPPGLPPGAPSDDLPPRDGPSDPPPPSSDGS